MGSSAIVARCGGGLRGVYEVQSPAQKNHGGVDDAACTAPVVRICGALLKARAPILPDPISRTHYVEYEPGVIGAAKAVIALIQGETPWMHVEHIGSTAVPGCAG